jgi:nitrogen-specific signal transduction histidine kinase
MSAHDRLSDKKMSASVLPPDALAESIRSLTHDLRGPLTSLQSCLSLVLSGDAGDLTADQRHFLNLGRRNIDRMDRMVEDMLNTARAGAKAAPQERPAVDLGPILTDAVRLHEMTAAERSLDLDAAGLPEEFFARVDADIVVRMLDNVVGNAVKYTPDGGLVRVWLESRQGTPRSLASQLARRWDLPLATFNLIVDDNGPGMSAGVLKKIFEPFNRGPLTEASTNPGTGLGLSITRALAESHGGEVRLVSLPGRGTTVWIRLPRDPVSEHLQISVHLLETALAEGPKGGVPPLVGVLDLREVGGDDMSAREMVEGFFDQETPGLSRSWEAVPGFWISAIVDPVNRNRRWSLFAARRGGGLESTRWEYLTPGNRVESTPTRPFEEQRETMVNSAPAGPNKY